MTLKWSDDQAELDRLFADAESAAIGAYNCFRLVPRIVAADGVEVARLRLRRTLLAESAVMVVIIAVTAVLTNTSPTTGFASASPSDEHSHHTSDGSDLSAAPEQSVEREDSFGDGNARVRVSPTLACVTKRSGR